VAGLPQGPLCSISCSQIALGIDKLGFLESDL